MSNLPKLNLPDSEKSPIQVKFFNNYPTYDKLMEVLHPDKILAAFAQIESISQSVSKPRITLQDLNDMYERTGFMPGVDFMMKWIDFLNKFSNINKPLNEKYPVAYMIYNNYKHLYLTDLKLVFEKLICGEYGTFYGSIDAQRILFAFREYNIERTRVQTKELKKIDREYVWLREKIEHEEKMKIWNSIDEKKHNREQRYAIFEQRCRQDLPGTVKQKILEYINEESKK